jgi:hypothetical protein
MGWQQPRPIANKFITIFSDNLVLPSQWKFMIPMLIVQAPLPVVINAKNFADGIQHNLELYDIQLPPEQMAFDELSNDYLIR